MLQWKELKKERICVRAVTGERGEVVYFLPSIGQCLIFQKQGLLDHLPAPVVTALSKLLLYLTKRLRSIFKRGFGLLPGSRNVPSSPSSARSRLAISEPLQSKSYVFLEAGNVLQDPVAGAMSLEAFNMQLQVPICGPRSQNGAAGA